MLVNFFRHGSNAAIVAALFVLAAILARHPSTWFAAAALGGALAFFLSEYGTHRFLFHARPSRNALIMALQRRLHYDHHVDPARLELLFLPLWFVVPVALAFFGAELAVLRQLPLALAASLGSLTALLYYEWTHLVAHVPYVPKTHVGRWLKKYHLRHHFMNERLWFGVTSPAMDFIGRTYARTVDAAKSGTTRELHVRR